MRIKDMSISDLKAAYDFVLIDLQHMEEEANRKQISPEQISAYGEVKETENDLYNQLINKTRELK